MLIVNESGGDTVFPGTLNNAGTLNKQGTSKLTLSGALVLNSNSMLEVNGGTLTLGASTAPLLA